MDETARDQILRAVRHLGGDQRTPFTPRDVIDELHRRGTSLADSTIRTHVTSRMCASAPAHHGTVYADLERVGRGLYRLTSSNGDGGGRS
jgi:hypothetical protein